MFDTNFFLSFTLLIDTIHYEFHEIKILNILKTYNFIDVECYLLKKITLYII